MLKENIKTIRKSKGLSQEELAIKLNVVRQTISKWEQGLSVPDAEMLITLSEVLETPVSTLLGENISESKVDDLNWDYSNPENAVLGVAFHSFEWLFVRIAPIILIVLIIGIFLTRKKD